MADACALDLERDGGMDVRSGAVAIFDSALAWYDGTIVAGTAVRGGVEHNGKILVAPLESGRYELLGREVDREEYGLAVWRLRRE